MMGPSPCVWGILWSALRTRSAPVHPHVYGEYGCRASVSGIGRSIPMCMGNTCLLDRYMPAPVHPHVYGEYERADRLLAPRQVHPHVYGEYLSNRTEQSIRVHPHVYGEYRHRICIRGIRGPSPCVWGIQRIKQTCRPEVHPHVYGEYSVPIWIHQGVGPSPCVWGIPATSTSSLELWVHPHVYGEYSARRISVPYGSIPMCMGNTYNA